MFISFSRISKIMGIYKKKSNVSKVYCPKCDLVFESREKYDKHYDSHSGVSCESCPLDTAIEKLVNLFKRKN